MAAIPTLEDNLTGAAAGVAVATTNSIFDEFTGAGTSIFNADEYVAGRPSVQVVCAVQSRNLRANHTAVGGWRGFALKITDDLDAATAIAAWYNNITIGGSIRLLTDSTIQIRDAGNVSRFISAAALTLNTWYWVTYRVEQNNARLKIYNGTTGALIQDSGALVTGFTTINPDNLRLGQQSSSTGTIRLARLRADDTNEPADASHGAPLAVGAMTAFHEINTAGSSGVMTLVRNSGDAVTITGPTSGVFKIQHPDPVVAAINLTLTATLGGTDTETFIIAAGSTTSITNRRVWNGTAWV